jgi:hypothetical protein
VTLPLTGLRGTPVRVPVCMAFDDVADGMEEDAVPVPAWVIPPIAIMATPAAAAMTMASLLGMDVSPDVGCTHGLPGTTRQKEKRRRATRTCGSRSTPRGARDSVTRRCIIATGMFPGTRLDQRAPPPVRAGPGGVSPG